MLPQIHTIPGDGLKLLTFSASHRPDYSRTPVAKTNLQRGGAKNAEVTFFALFVPLRCLVPLSLRGVFGKIAVTLGH